MIYEWMFSIFHHRLHRLTQIFHLWDFLCVFVPLCSFEMYGRCVQRSIAVFTTEYTEFHGVFSF